MKKLGVLMLAMSLLAGCSQDAMMAGDERGCMSAWIEDLRVQPQELTRGSDDEITVTVVLSDSTEPAVQVELVTDGEIEAQVELGLGLKSTTGVGHGVYEGTLLNPFGLGLAPGNVAVKVVLGERWDCFSESSGTTSFSLK